MAGIEEYLNKIKNAVYGREVRQAIHDGIHACYEDGKAGAVDLVARQQIAELVAPSGEAPSAAEVTDARVGADGVTHPSLGLANRMQFSNIGDFNYYSPYLSSSQSSVGRWWNTAINKTISQGEQLLFKLESYSGQLFTSCAVGYVDSSNGYHAIKSGMLIGTEYLIIAPTDINKLYVQIVRSANEYDVSAKFYLDVKNSKGLNGKINRNSSDIASLQMDVNFDETVEFSISSSQNYTIYGNFKSGQTITVDVDFSTVGDGQKNVLVDVSGNSIVFYNSGSKPFTFTSDADKIMVYVNIVGTVTMTGSVRLYAGLVSDVDKLKTAISSLQVRNVYHVEKDGSGDFTSLVDAINTACQNMDSIVYVGAGTWNLIDELGSAYIESVGSSKRGLYLKNRVHVICSSDAIITCHYTGTRADTIQWLSAFNAGEYGFTLENARIESSNCRYSVHDERDTSTDDYTNVYINCSMKHDNTSGGFPQCLGGGLGKNGHIIIDGCIFENPHVGQTGIVSYHNTWYAGGDGRSTVEVKGCYIKGTNTFRCSWFGASQEISTFLVHDNSLGKAPIHVVENQSMMDDNPSWIQNTELLAWNNEIRT